MNLFFALLVLLSSVAFSSDGAEPIDPVYEKLKIALHQHVVTETGKESEDVDIQWVGYAANIPCATSSDVWVSTLPGEQFRGQSTARVTFVDSAGVCGKVSVPFKAVFWANVPVAAVDTQSGMTVDYKLERVLATDIRGIVVDPSNGPWIAVGSLRKGEAITHRRVKRKPVAAVGEMIEIVAQYGPLTISAEGRMLADAFIGESVRVANLATDAVVQGVLVAPGKVKTGVRR